jgi:hypothetical protein
VGKRTAIASTGGGNRQPTLDYIKKRKADGKGKMEIIRCLKRFVAREIFGYLRGARRIVDFTPENHFLNRSECSVDLKMWPSRAHGRRKSGLEADTQSYEASPQSPTESRHRLAASSRIQIGGHQHGFGGIERAYELFLGREEPA